MKQNPFSTEAELVSAFCRSVSDEWTAYHETAGWDLLLVHRDTGEQVGVEAKLSLNAKVLEQALPGRWTDQHIGPDYRAVLVPTIGLQHHLSTIAQHVGIAVIRLSGPHRGFGAADAYRYQFNPSLPDRAWNDEQWPNWCPANRCKLPDYIPDVTGGHSAPVKLSEWKIKAIKLLILLERNGTVSRRDMAAIKISPTRWTDRYYGFLTPSPEGYIRSERTPDLKVQHPENWGQIEADIEVWGKHLILQRQPSLLGAA